MCPPETPKCKVSLFGIMQANGFMSPKNDKIGGKRVYLHCSF